MFEFKDEEGVFYDVLKKVNSEKLRNSYFINFRFVQVRRLSEKLGASVAAKQEALPALYRQKCTDKVRNEPFFHRL